MILTTTHTIDGHEVEEYVGLVFGEVVAGVDFVRDIAAGLRNIIGGRSGSYERELQDARNEALNELAARAEERGANAVIGIKVDYETLGSANNMLMVNASGTAVRLRRR